MIVERNIKQKILPPHTAAGRILRKIYYCVFSGTARREKKLSRIDKHVEQLLDPECLDEKIAYLQAMADSRDIRKNKYFVSDFKYNTMGLCTLITHHFCSIAYAIATGKIPVIDMQSHGNAYLEKEKTGKENAWENYFEQPFGYGMEALRGGHIETNKGVMNSNCLPELLKGNEQNFEVCFNAWRTIYRHFFRVNDTARKFIDEEYKRLIKPGMRVLGVLRRGTDYNPSMAPGHLAQPDIEVIADKVKAAMTEWECDYIFLATEEKKSFDYFESRFPGRVLRNNAPFYDTENIDFERDIITNVRFERPNDAYLRGLEYLTTVVILSRCTSAVLSQTAGSMVARYINDGMYENVYVFNVGAYPVQ